MGEVTLKVPAEYAADFRMAVIEEMALDVAAVRDYRKDLFAWLERNPDKDPSEADADLRATTGLLTRSIALAGLVDLAGDGAIEIQTDDVETLDHTLQAMAQDVVAPRVAENLRYSPIDSDVMELVCPLVESLSWAVDHEAGIDAEWHADRKNRKNGQAA
jgi:hypothetical protein